MIAPDAPGRSLARVLYRGLEIVTVVYPLQFNPG
jgi:hypothetical protein